MRIHCRHLIVLAILALCSSCSEGPLNSLPLTLNSLPLTDAEAVMGTWVLLRYSNLESGFIRNQPKTLAQPIQITFHGDSTLSGHTPRNTIFGTYLAQDGGSITILQFGGTLVGEDPWGNRFWEKFPKVDCFEASKDSLRLYLNNRLEALTFVDSALYDHDAYSQLNASDETYEIHEEHRRYFGHADVATIWVYRNQNQAVDTMRVSFSKKKYLYSDEDDAYYEFVYYQIQSSLKDKLICYAYAVDQGTSSNYCFYYPISVGLGVAYIKGDFQPSCVDFDNDHINQDCNTTVTVLESLVVGQATYNDVIKVAGTETFNSNPIVTAYYAKDIGLIRKIYKDGEIFNLINYMPTP